MTGVGASCDMAGIQVCSGMAPALASAAIMMSTYTR